MSAMGRRSGFARGRADLDSTMPGVVIERESEASTGRPVKVLYVLGNYRSGTTLLSNLIGQLDGFVCVGELRALWRELGAASSRCGCGWALRECKVWSPVLAEAIGNRAAIDAVASELLDLQRRRLGHRHTWRKLPSLLARTNALATPDEALARYAKVLARVYRAIADVTGARVVVDSSKEATDATTLRLRRDLRPYLVQIVRDARGTVYSGLRAQGGGAPVTQIDLSRTAYATISWCFGNLAGRAVQLTYGHGRTALFRYEDLIDQPGRTLTAIGDLVGEPSRPSFLDGRLAVMQPTHSVAGNDSRFQTGTIPLRSDTDWISHLHPLNRSVVTVLAAPLLAAFHYPISVRHAGPNPSPACGGSRP
ncbi:MAG: sulfotransferase [Acidimicrobiales bacterium]